MVGRPEGGAPDGASVSRNGGSELPDCSLAPTRRSRFRPASGCGHDGPGGDRQPFSGEHMVRALPGRPAGVSGLPACCSAACLARGLDGRARALRCDLPTVNNGPGVVCVCVCVCVGGGGVYFGPGPDSRALSAAQRLMGHRESGCQGLHPLAAGWAKLAAKVQRGSVGNGPGVGARARRVWDCLPLTHGTAGLL